MYQLLVVITGVSWYEHGTVLLYTPLFTPTIRLEYNMVTWYTYTLAQPYTMVTPTLRLDHTPW